jgi:hypothetical protein
MHFGLSGITGSRVRGSGGEWVGCEGVGLVLLAVGDVRQERLVKKLEENKKTPLPAVEREGAQATQDRDRKNSTWWQC